MINKNIQDILAVYKCCYRHVESKRSAKVFMGLAAPIERETQSQVKDQSRELEKKENKLYRAAQKSGERADRTR